MKGEELETASYNKIKMCIKEIVNNERQHREYEDSYILQSVVYNT